MAVFSTAAPAAVSAKVNEVWSGQFVDAERLPPRARAFCRCLPRRGFANLFRCKAHFFSDVGDPSAKFFEQVFDAGEVFIDGGEYAGRGIFHAETMGEG
jgi:hypothetical protein